MDEHESKPPASVTRRDDGAASDGRACAAATPDKVAFRSDAIVSLATKKSRRATKRGWGPFQSVVKERSADFNLTLDVNNLRQEVQQLASVRDHQRAQVLIQRQSPEGALTKMVHECFRVLSLRSVAASAETGQSCPEALGAAPFVPFAPFATAATLDDSHAPSSDWSLRQLLHRVMHERVDFGCDVCGPDALADLVQRLCCSLRALGVSLEALEVETAEEAVIISTRAKFRFQVVRETIEQHFQHIQAHRRLVAALMGREIEADGRLIFFFDENDKCVQLVSDIDFVGAFGAVLVDPRDLALLLNADFLAAFEAIEDYFRCFESAFALFNLESPAHHGRLDLVRAFMERAFTPDMRYGHHLAGSSALERRWAALSDSFELHAFRPDGPPRDVTSELDGGAHRLRVVAVRAVYALHITARTLARVFPLLLPPRDAPILRHLLGQTLAVPAQLTFSLDAALRVARIDERVEFAATLHAALHPIAWVDTDAVLAGVCLEVSGLADEMLGRGLATPIWGRARSNSEPPAGPGERRRRVQSRMSFSDLLGGQAAE